MAPRKKLEQEYKHYVLWEAVLSPDGTKTWKGTISEENLTIIMDKEKDAFDYALEYLEGNPGSIMIVGILPGGKRKEIWTLKKFD